MRRKGVNIPWGYARKQRFESQICIFHILVSRGRKEAFRIYQDLSNDGTISKLMRLCHKHGLMKSFVMIAESRYGEELQDYLTI